jgi:hypothetical protein
MPLSALALVITAALLHAMWNFLAKQAGGDARFGLLSSILLMLFWAPLGIYMGWDVVPTWRRAEKSRPHDMMKHKRSDYALV